MDSRLLLEKQVKAVARMAFAQLHVLCQLCPFLDSHALCLVICALVTFCLAYGNALHMGPLLKSVWKFQLVQSAVV